MQSFEKIAKILRAQPETIQSLEQKLDVLTGKQGGLDKIVEQNEVEIRKRLDLLDLGRNVSVKRIYDALISKIEADDDKLFKQLGSPSAAVPADWQRVLGTAKKMANGPRGFFLKKEKAMEFLKNRPPLKILDVLGYKNIDDMLAKENIFEIFCALRFVEGNEWLNKNFFNQYKNLKPSDFEKREIGVLALPERWAKIAQNFIKYKYHNISHLKELGVIFVLPLSLEISGETMRNFGLILHYFNEVGFYSELFEKFAVEPNNFAQNLISLLRGDTISERPTPSETGKTPWLVIQKYLAKDDKNDWRLFEPHVNPEAIHWEKAEKMLSQNEDLLFWQNLNWVGDYFSVQGGDENRGEVLVSFNLIDMAFSLVKEREFVKYLFHHQESLWNKIFIEYFGDAKMEELIKENIIKGWFEV